MSPWATAQWIQINTTTYFNEADFGDIPFLKPVNKLD